MDGVVDSLVYRRHDPTIGLAYLADLRNLPCHVTRQRKLLEETLLVQIVDFAKGIGDGVIHVEGVEIPHVCLLGVKRL